MSVPDYKTKWNDKNSIIKVLIDYWKKKELIQIQDIQEDLMAEFLFEDFEG